MRNSNSYPGFGPVPPQYQQAGHGFGGQNYNWFVPSTNKQFVRSLEEALSLPANLNSQNVYFDVNKNITKYLVFFTKNYIFSSIVAIFLIVFKSMFSLPYISRKYWVYLSVLRLNHSDHRHQKTSICLSPFPARPRSIKVLKL